MAEPTNRRRLLNNAADIIDGDRNVDYGDPNEDFRRTAAYWSIHAGAVLRRRINEAGLAPSDVVTTGEVVDFVDSLFDPWDVAIMMNLLKASRLSWSPRKEDHWMDTAGYAACGWDCVVAEERE